MSKSVIDTYIEGCPEEIQEKLIELRDAIRSVVPEASEKLSYQMPTFYLNGNLVHFAANKNHIGFYPAPSAIIRFKSDLTQYKQSKGAVQFPLDQPIPIELVKKMTAFRLEENMNK